MEKKIVYFDMDGVLVHWPEGDGEKNFSSMKPNKDIIKCLRALANDQRYEVYIASTAPWSQPEAWMHKREWVERHIGHWVTKRLILTHNKHLLIGDYLIDDRDVNGAGEFTGKLIKFLPGTTSEDIFEAVKYYY